MLSVFFVKLQTRELSLGTSFLGRWHFRGPNAGLDCLQRLPPEFARDAGLLDLRLVRQHVQIAASRFRSDIKSADLNVRTEHEAACIGNIQAPLTRAAFYGIADA